MISQAEKNYRKKVKRITVDLYQSDKDIIDWASNRKGAQATEIKRLIRESLKMGN